MFRLAFWLGVILVLLPANEQQQACLYGVATSAVERITTLAEFGYRLVRDLKRQDDATTPPPGTGAARKVDQRGTPAPMDMQPAWRGSGPRSMASSATSA
jgi:hypothetical protein